MAEHLFPRKDGEFNTFFFALVLYLFGVDVPDPVTPAAGPNATRLVIAAGYLDDLWQLFNQWADVYPKAVNSLTSTQPLVTTKDILRKQIEDKLREIYGDIPESKLTVEDRLATRLKLRDLVPTDTPAATYAPDINIHDVQHLHHKLLIVDPIKGNRAIANGLFIDLAVAIAEPDLPEAQIPFNKNHHVSDAFFDVEFNAADKGKTVYYQACYENARHEKGPKSPVVSAVIM